MVSNKLILSHGQASVERVFNINKEMIVENQKDEPLIALRSVYDHINKPGGPLEDLVISKGLINSVRVA